MLKSYFNNGSSKTYNIKINTSYKKVSAAKDATGNTTDFKLTTNLNLNYEIIDSKEIKQNKSISFSESFIIKRNQNNYEQNNYERIVIKNLTEILAEKIILHLSRS